MDAVLYKKIVEKTVHDGHGQEGALGPLSPEVFYPLVTEEEKVTWTHWLPTRIMFDRTLMSPATIIGMLARLKAPPEVLEEFRWASKMNLFETYEVRTPRRRDARDPLLLGCAGGQTYRLALWGESLRPIDEITALVKQSLSLRARAAKRGTWFGIGGNIPALALASWLSYRLWEGQPLNSGGVMVTFLLLIIAWLPMLVSTPENQQHDFLDRYRQ